MRLTLRKPTKSRAERFSSVFGAIGAVVGSLPIGVTAKSRKKPSPATAAKIVAPVGAAVAVLGAVVKRRKGKSDAQETWSGYEAPPSATTPQPPVAAPVPTTEAVATETEREKLEETNGGVAATDQPGVEGAVETPPAAAGETPASPADLSNPETQSTS